MTVPIKQRVTLGEFEGFIARPENMDKTFEFIGGEIVEVPSNAYVSKIAAKIITFIGMYLLQHDIGHVTGEAGGYMVGGERYAPDVAFISYDRQPELADKGYNPNPPELVVEVISDPSNADEQRQLRVKLTSYLASGILVWVVNPAERSVEVHQLGATAKVLNDTDTLIAENILPNFKLAVKDIFPKKSAS